MPWSGREILAAGTSPDKLPCGMANENTLYYGDNLDILRRYIDDESVDLIYLDPPFNSDAENNVLFAEKSGEKAHSQIKAFEDTWTWDLEAAQDLLDGKKIDMPAQQDIRSFKQAPRQKKKQAAQNDLF
jgi:DNA modification methylase